MVIPLWHTKVISQRKRSFSGQDPVRSRERCIPKQRKRKRKGPPLFAHFSTFLDSLFLIQIQRTQEGPSVRSTTPKVEPPMCRICFEPCLPLFDPAAEASRAGTSDSLPVGKYIGNPTDKHIACLDCLQTFIRTKVDDQSKRAFPITCHEVLLHALPLC